MYLNRRRIPIDRLFIQRLTNSRILLFPQGSKRQLDCCDIALLLKMSTEQPNRTMHPTVKKNRRTDRRSTARISCFQSQKNTRVRTRPDAGKTGDLHLQLCFSQTSFERALSSRLASARDASV